MTEEKLDLLSIPYFIIDKGHLAVQDTEILKNSMIIVRQYSVCEKRKSTCSDLFLKDFGSKTLIANHTGHLGGLKTSADTWINSLWRTSPIRLPEENAKDTKTTFS